MDVHRSSASDHPRALSDLKDARFFGNSKAMWVTGGERLCLYEDAYLKEQSRLTHRYSPEHSCPVPTKPGRQAQLNELPPWWIHRACPSGAQVWLPSRQGLEGGAITEKKNESFPSAEMCVHEPFFSQPHPKTNISSTPKDLKECRSLRISILARVLSSYLKIYMHIRVETCQC